MGVVQSKKKEVKAYANKYTSSFLPSNSTSASSTQTQTNNTSSKKYLDDSRKKSSIYSADGVPRSSTPISSSNTTSNTPSNKYNVAPSKMSTSSNNDDVDYYGEPTLQTVHHSNSFYLPKDWDMQEYQYNVTFPFSFETSLEINFYLYCLQLHFALKTLHGG